MQPLQSLGLSELAERLYLGLVESGEADPAELAARQGRDQSDVDAALTELSGIGLVDVQDALVIPRPPQLALETLAERHVRDAALARRTGESLSRVWRAAVDRQSPVELLPSLAAWRAAGDRIQGEAQRQVRALSVGSLSPDVKIAHGMFEALERGVEFEVIYGAHVLQDPASLRLVQQCVEAGEQARVFPRVPMNVTIVDDRWALIGARSSGAGAGTVAAAVVSRSPFLTGLVGIFDAFWRMAVPITSNTEADELGGAPSPDSKRLLTYLSAGLTDEAIAREFGISERTVARRITRLQETLGAQTRFQLGVQASRQGWL